MSVKLLSVLVLAAAIGCSTATAGSGARGRESNVITEQEIATSHLQTAHDVIARLRPIYLRSRGRTTVNAGAIDYASVFMDGQYFGDISALRTIQAASIREIRYLNGPDAATRFGMQFGAGAIAITTR
jgi:hypothetical protein